MARTQMISCAIGSLLLLAMAAFHGSGHAFVSAAIADSNAPAFLKEVVPAVFLHVSIHLAGLSAFGFLAMFLRHDAHAVVALLAIVVLADALLALHMGGVVPAAVLACAAACFIVATAPRARGIP
jgi:hypothetical protein